MLIPEVSCLYQSLFFFFFLVWEPFRETFAIRNTHSDTGCDAPLKCWRRKHGGKEVRAACTRGCKARVRPAEGAWGIVPVQCAHTVTHVKMSQSATNRPFTQNALRPCKCCSFGCGLEARPSGCCSLWLPLQLQSEASGWTRALQASGNYAAVAP